jgi:hypothetical protein
MKSLMSFIHQPICRRQASCQLTSWNVAEVGKLGLNEPHTLNFDRISDYSYTKSSPS